MLKSSDPGMKQSEQMPEIINDRMLKRRLIYNAVPSEDAEKTCVIAGLSRSSPDVEEMEKKASLERFQRLMPILPVISILANSLAEVTTAVSIETLEEAIEGVPEEVKDNIASVSNANIHSTLISALSVLIDLGFIQVTGEVQ